MPLKIKIESLLARGEFSTEERDRLLSALRETPPTEKHKLRRKRLVTPLRIFLVGVLCGLGVAYLVWGLTGGLA